MKPSLPPQPLDYDMVITDIEGTTTPIAFVKDVLFKYVEDELEAWLEERIPDLFMINSTSTTSHSELEGAACGTSITDAVDGRDSEICKEVKDDEEISRDSGNAHEDEDRRVLSGIIERLRQLVSLACILLVVI